MHKKIIRENKTIYLMIKMYCNYYHHTKELCHECSTIYNYAEKRTANCVFGNEKPVCEQCSVHCYKPDMKEKIREIMRFSGPRMILHYPLKAVFHLIRKFSPKSQTVKKFTPSKINN